MLPPWPMLGPKLSAAGFGMLAHACILTQLLPSYQNVLDTSRGVSQLSLLQSSPAKLPNQGAQQQQHHLAHSSLQN
jgi:hypothetical protein